MLRFILDSADEIRRIKKEKFSLRYIVVYLNYLVELYKICFISAFINFKRKHDFKNYIIGNLTDYYLVIINSTHTFAAEPECNNISFHHNCSNDNDLSGYKNDTNINNINFTFRKLVSKSFCHEIYSSFIEYKGKPLSYIFDFNISILFGISIPILIIYLFFVCSPLFFIFCRNFLDKKMVKIVILFLYIEKFVLFIIFFYFFHQKLFLITFQLYLSFPRLLLKSNKLYMPLLSHQRLEISRNIFF